MKKIQQIDGEIAEIFETFRSMFRVTISISAILTTANITFLGFAINNKSAALIFIGIFFPLVMMIFTLYIYRILEALAFSALKLEKSTADSSLFFSAVMSLLSPDTRSNLLEIIKIENLEGQVKQLREKYKIPFTPFTHIFMPLWAFLQISGSIILWYFFDWPTL